MLEPQAAEGSALATKTEQSPTQENGKANLSRVPRRDNKDNLWCTYCKKPRQTRERCWKLHGKPPSREWGNQGGQQRPHGQAHLIEQTNENGKPEQSGINNEEIEKIRGLIGSMKKPSSACPLALSGKSPFSFGFYVSKKCSVNYWIVDSGTTDHMTNSSQCFSTYTPCPNNRKIIVANGSLATVAGLGDIQVTPFIILKDVHHVPMLLVNHISIQKIIKRKINCHTVFHPSYCVFQDQVSGRTIGLAKEKDELYYLETPINSKKVIIICLSFLSSSSKDVIWLHHFHLRHSSFRVLNIMFQLCSKN